MFIAVAAPPWQQDYGTAKEQYFYNSITNKIVNCHNLMQLDKSHCVGIISLWAFQCAVLSFSTRLKEMAILKINNKYFLYYEFKVVCMFVCSSVCLSSYRVQDVGLRQRCNVWVRPESCRLELVFCIFRFCFSYLLALLSYIIIRGTQQVLRR